MSIEDELNFSEEDLLENSGKADKELALDAVMGDVLKEQDEINDSVDVLKDVDDEGYSLHDASIRTLNSNMQQGGALQKLIEDPVQYDSLYLSLKNNESTATVLNYVMQEMAEEAAYLKAWRKNNFNLTEDSFSEVSDKRVMALKKIIEALERKEKLINNKSQSKIDFRSEAFSKIFEFFLKSVKMTFKKVNVPDQYNDIFFSQLAKELDGFEDKAERLYYGKKLKQEK